MFDPNEKVRRKEERSMINAYLKMPCKVSYIPSRMGKTPFAQKNVIFMEYDNLLPHMANYLPSMLHKNQDFVNFFGKSPKLLDSFADQFLLSLPAPRSAFYLQPFDSVTSDVMGHVRFAEDALGYYPVTIEAMILQDFKVAHLSVTFLGLVFNLVMLLLFTISVLLIYSLLMLSVENKSFDLGVMRMVGLSKTNVIALVVMQSFTFVVPSIIAGFSISLVLLRGAKFYSETYLQMDFESVPSLFSCLQALFLSTMIPLISSIMPIRVVLDRNLNDALDI